jgi:hypothetical protein
MLYATGERGVHRLSVLRANGSRVATQTREGEHTFVTTQGSAYARFRRALNRGNVTDALSAAAELEHVGLIDALELVLLLAREGDERRFRRGAVRGAARYTREAGDVEPAESQAVLRLVTMLGGPGRASRLPTC